MRVHSVSRQIRAQDGVLERSEDVITSVSWSRRSYSSKHSADQQPRAQFERVPYNRERNKLRTRLDNSELVWRTPAKDEKLGEVKVPAPKHWPVPCLQIGLLEVWSKLHKSCSDAAPTDHIIMMETDLSSLRDIAGDHAQPSSPLWMWPQTPQAQQQAGQSRFAS